MDSIREEPMLSFTHEHIRSFGAITRKITLRYPDRTSAEIPYKAKSWLWTTKDMCAHAATYWATAAVDSMNNPFNMTVIRAMTKGAVQIMSDVLAAAWIQIRWALNNRTACSLCLTAWSLCPSGRSLQCSAWFLFEFMSFTDSFQWLTYRNLSLRRCWIRQVDDRRHYSVRWPINSSCAWPNAALTPIPCAMKIPTKILVFVIVTSTLMHINEATNKHTRIHSTIDDVRSFLKWWKNDKFL